MARPAPGTDRTVLVVEFLARHPGQSYSLSELARRLGLNKSTAHALLHALADRGWLLRHPDQTVSLGPSLVAVGEAASASFPALAAARAEAAALGQPAVLSAVVGRDIVILVGGPAAPTGQRIPLEPPLGSVFLAWGVQAAVDAWLTAADPPDRAGLTAVLATVRDRGFAVGLQAGSRQRLGKAMAELRHPDTIDRAPPAALRRLVRELLDELGHEGPLLAEIDPATNYLVDDVAAPVFGPDGRVELAITVVGFEEELTGRELIRIGHSVRDAADRATATRGGTLP